MSRIKAAFRTNETQAVSVFLFTVLTCLPALNHLDDWRVWLFALTVWPSVAFVSNLLDPIRRYDE